MQFTLLKTVVAAAWLLAVIAVAVSIPIVTVTGWTTTVGVVVIPLVLLLRALHQPEKTLSQTIQAETRRR